MASDLSPAPRTHGGLAGEELEALGLDPDAVIDFSVNVNPFGPSPAVAAAARAARIDRYPDPTAGDLRRAIARRWDVSPDRIVVGNGAADLLWTLARVLVRPGEPVLVAEPTFAELRAAAQAAGAVIHEWRADTSTDFAVDLAAIGALARTSAARLAYLCSPNTPTGAHVPVAAVAALACEHPGVTFVLDQAFLSLSDHHEELAEPVPPNVVRVRSLTKDHALPGLRLGYLISGAGDLARSLEACRPPWTTSAIAQAAGLAALADDAFVDDSRGRLLDARDRLAAGLRRLGLAPVPTTTAFLMVEVGDALGLRTRLLHRGILVRDCASFGLPGHVRIAARPPRDQERLIAALGQELR